MRLWLGIWVEARESKERRARLRRQAQRAASPIQETSLEIPSRLDCGATLSTKQPVIRHRTNMKGQNGLHWEHVRA